MIIRTLINKFLSGDGGEVRYVGLTWHEFVSKYGTKLLDFTVIFLGFLMVSKV